MGLVWPSQPCLSLQDQLAPQPHLPPSAPPAHLSRLSLCAQAWWQFRGENHVWPLGGGGGREQDVSWSRIMSRHVESSPQRWDLGHHGYPRLRLGRELGGLVTECP